MIKDLCFEIIEACPNNCMFCSSNSCIDKKRMIDFDTFKRTIDYLNNRFGIREVSLSGGEPLLHPNLFDMIKYLKQLGIRVVLFTSGIKKQEKMTTKEISNLECSLRMEYSSYLNEGMSRDEFESLISMLMKRYVFYSNRKYINISSEEFIMMEKVGLDKIVFDFQAWNREVYNMIMGTKECYDAFLGSLAKVSHYNIEKDVLFIPTKLNFRELPDIIEMLNCVPFENLSLLNFVPQGRGRDNKEELLMSDEDYKEFREIYNKEKDKFKGVIRVGIPFLGENSHKCTAGFTKLDIRYDGVILPCPAFKDVSLDVLNSLGFSTPNIYNNMEDLCLMSESLEVPLCKRLYNFSHSIK